VAFTINVHEDTMTSRRRFIAATFATGVTGAIGTLPLAAGAQARYPSKPITLIDPFSAGSNTDYFSRAVADEMAHLLGQPMIVDNRTGGGGSLGAEAVARAAADGHTIGLASVSTHAANPAVNKGLRYDPLKDFAPITSLVTLPSITVVLSSSPIKTLAQLLQEAKAKPEQISFASPGVGSAGHVLLEQFSHLAGVKFLHVPYRGSGQILTDLFGGQVAIASDNIPSLLPHIQSGKLRALAVRDQQRVAQLPDVPTFKELGFDAVSRPLWFGLVAPAATPPAVVARLNEVALQAMRTPSFQRKAQMVGATIMPSSPEEFRQRIQNWLEDFRKTVQVAHIVAQ
jgi:tripartite-type tricarboxylate transporter receptor subunit TctC